MNVSEKLPTMKWLIEHCGTWVGDSRRCSCCNKTSVFAIQYGDNSGDVFLACTHCDVDKLEK